MISSSSVLVWWLDWDEETQGLSLFIIISLRTLFKSSCFSIIYPCCLPASLVRTSSRALKSISSLSYFSSGIYVWWSVIHRSCIFPSSSFGAQLNWDSVSVGCGFSSNSFVFRLSLVNIPFKWSSRRFTLLLFIISSALPYPDLELSAVVSPTCASWWRHLKRR